MRVSKRSLLCLEAHPARDRILREAQRRMRWQKRRQALLGLLAGKGRRGDSQEHSLVGGGERPLHSVTDRRSVPSPKEDGHPR